MISRITQSECSSQGSQQNKCNNLSRELFIVCDDKVGISLYLKYRLSPQRIIIFLNEILFTIIIKQIDMMQYDVKDFFFF